MVQRCQQSGLGHGRGRDLSLPSPLLRPGTAARRMSSPRGLENLWRLPHHSRPVGHQGSQATATMTSVHTQTVWGRGHRIQMWMGLPAMVTPSVSVQEHSESTMSSTDENDDLASDLSPSTNVERVRDNSD